MATYVPNPADKTQPTEDKFVESAAAEFRALKKFTLDSIAEIEQDIDNLAPGGSISSDAVADIFSGDGSATTFNLFRDPGRLANLDVSISGVTQRPTIDYTWVYPGTTLTFTTAPIAGTDNILVRYTEGLAPDSSGNFREDLANTASTTLGDALVGVKQPFPGSMARTQHDKNKELLTSADFSDWGQRVLFVGQGNTVPATSGIENISVGYDNFLHLGLGWSNIAIGNDVYGRGVLTGGYNIGIGGQSHLHMTSGSENVTIGVYSGRNITTGVANTGVGTDANRYLETGIANASVGVQASYNNVTGSHNVSMGANAFRGSVNPPDDGPGTGPSASFNVALGSHALYTATGFENVGIGYQAGWGTTGSYNVYVGGEAGHSVVSGAQNVMLGYKAGADAAQPTDTAYSVVVGSESYVTGNNAIAIGKGIFAPANTTVIGTPATTDTKIWGGFVPQVDQIQNLGTPTLRWSALYCIWVHTAPTQAVWLPPATPALAGARSFLTDVVDPTFGVIVTGGGTNAVPVYCTGLNWHVG